MDIMYWRFPTWHGYEDYVYRVESKSRLSRAGGFYCEPVAWDGSTPIVKLNGAEHRGVRCDEHGDTFPPSEIPPQKAASPVPIDAWSTQVGGDHYCKLPIQPFQYSMANGLDPMQHTIIKYVTRFRDKGGLVDLSKAKQTIDLLIAFEQSKEK